MGNSLKRTGVSNMKPLTRRLLLQWLSGLPSSFILISFIWLAFSIGGERDIPTALMLMGVLSAVAMTIGAMVMGQRSSLDEFAEDQKKQLVEVEDRIDAIGQAVDPSWNSHLINRIHVFLRNGQAPKAVAAIHDDAGESWDEAHRRLRKWQNVGTAMEKLELLERALSGSQNASV